MEDHGAVFVYVEGEREPSPSASKGYLCTAADAVDWWDASERRLGDHSRLVRLARACLRGDADSAFRGVRADNNDRRCNVEGLTLEGVVDAASSPGGPGARTRLVADVLDAYVRRGLAPKPVLERAGRVFSAGDPGELARVDCLLSAGRRCGVRLAAVLKEVAEGRACVVFYDSQQLAFVRAHVGAGAFAAATEGRVVVVLKDFCRCALSSSSSA